MVTLQSLLGTIYNPSPGRPSSGEVVQIGCLRPEAHTLKQPPCSPICPLSATLPLSACHLYTSLPPSHPHFLPPPLFLSFSLLWGSRFQYWGLPPNPTTQPPKLKPLEPQFLRHGVAVSAVSPPCSCEDIPRVCSAHWLFPDPFLCTASDFLQILGVHIRIAHDRCGHSICNRNEVWRVAATCLRPCNWESRPF
jgi:hypothetical protein